MSITIEDVRSKVITLDEVYTHLDKTEPLAVEHIDHESKIGFELAPDWAMGLDAVENTDPIDATMTIDGTERRLTKEAILQAGTNFGLLKPYMKKIPAALTSRLLAYHYGAGMGSEEFNVLIVDDNIVAFTPPTITPFSTRRLLDQVVDGAHALLGQQAPIFADWKISNTLQRTDVRLILPTESRNIHDGGMPDVPSDEQDVWYRGIHLTNSLMGKGQTSMDTYLFRYWCSNGCITKYDKGAWSRRIDGQGDDVYGWARDQVEAVLGGQEALLDQIQGLTRLDTSNNTQEVLRQIFDDYKVPVSQRAQIERPLLDAPVLTLYTILNAITEAANLPDLPDARRDALMRIGGELPTDTFDTMKAKIWREGHTADPTAPNPYDIRVI